MINTTNLHYKLLSLKDKQIFEWTMHQDCSKCVEPKSLYDTIIQMFYNEFTGTADIKNSSMKGYTIFLYDIENKEINTAAYVSPE